jgi:succinyl-CoA synthetase alpha subunit
VPGKVLLGTQESKFYSPGPVGLIARSGALAYEVALGLTQRQIGQSIAVNLGSAAIVGSSFSQWLQILAMDRSTEVIVLVDQTGGLIDDATAEYIAQAIDKPVLLTLLEAIHPWTNKLVIQVPLLRLSYQGQLPMPVQPSTKWQHLSKRISLWQSVLLRFLSW